MLDDINRSSHIASPAWTLYDSIYLNGWYCPDPSVKTAVLYGMKVWTEGKLLDFTQTRPQIVEGRGSRFRGYLPVSLVHGGVIPQMKAVLPLKLVHRMRTMEMELAPGGNLILSIDGFVVQFFDLKRTADGIAMCYGIMRQEGQSSEQFSPFEEECQVWMERLQICGGDGQWSPLTRTMGSGRKGDSWVWSLNAKVSGAGNDPVKLRWEIPAVVQWADLEFSLEQVEVP